MPCALCCQVWLSRCCRGSRVVNSCVALKETRDEVHQAKSKLQLQASLPHILIMATLSRSAHDEGYTKVAPPPPHPLKGRAIIVTGEHSHLTCWA